MDTTKLKDIDYMSEDTIAALDQLPEGAWTALLEACEEGGMSDPGVDCKITVTHETLENFENSRKNHWAECKDHDAFSADRNPAHIYYGIQLAKGGKRHQIIVVDFGELRAVLSN